MFAQLGQGFEIGPFLFAEQTFVIAIHQLLESLICMFGKS